MQEALRTLISLLAAVMKQCHGQRWHCESCRIATPHFVSVQQAVRLLGVTRKRRDWWRDYLRLTLRGEFPISKMYWVHTGNQNIWQSM